jgi:phosphate starvation-inducible PhoH-like protein
LLKASRILQNIEGIAHVQLDEADVVRHRLVKQIIRAYDKDQEREEELEQKRSQQWQALGNQKNNG